MSPSDERKKVETLRKGGQERQPAGVDGWEKSASGFPTPLN